MPLYNILGNMGDGKTLKATQLALIQNEPIYSNYHIHIDKFNSDYETDLEWYMLQPEMLNDLNEGSFVIIDEGYTWLESRGCGGKDMNKYLSYQLFQSRKKNMKIITTDQLLITIDPRFRLLATMNIEARRFDIGFKYTFQICNVYRQTRPHSEVLPNETAELIYPYYDTNEIINPVDDGLIYAISKDKSGQIENIEKIVDELLEKAPAKAYSEKICRYYCEKHKIPVSLAPRIQSAIKSRAMGI